MTLDHSTRAGGRVTGISLGHRELAEADHWILSLDPPPAYACTHLVREPFPHVAVSLVGVPAPGTAPELRAAADAAAAGQAGRAVRYPGMSELTGILTVADVLARSAIDRVEVLGAGDSPPDPGTLLDTRDFVRPQWRDGELVLTTTPAAGGRLIPFETRNPTPCCAGH